MKLRDGCVLKKARSGWTLLVLEGSGQRALRVNDSFAELWSAASGMDDITPESLAEAVMERYELDAEEALERSREIIGLWQGEGLTNP